MGGRVALVTGGSRGIGRACAVALASEGHRVAVTYGHDADAAEETRAAVEAVNGECLSIKADAADSDAVDAAFGEVESAFGKVEVLVVSAGITRDGLVMRMTDKQWDDVLHTNLRGAFLAVRRATPGMVRARWGRIVTISSVVGLSGQAGQVNYGASKAGLVGLTRSVARELASRNITANVVAPGPIATAMTDERGDDWNAEITSRVPLGRFGSAEEVAAVVSFLCSDPAGYVTGAVVPVDGGLGMGH
jgi:3-oxoacyl-(acyl-carrier-protein) reductase